MRSRQQHFALHSFIPSGDLHCSSTLFTLLKGEWKKRVGKVELDDLTDVRFRPMPSTSTPPSAHQKHVPSGTYSCPIFFPWPTHISLGVTPTEHNCN